MEICFGEQIQAKVYEDEILGELCEDLEEVLGSELRSARHVIVCIVLECDTTEEKGDNSWDVLAYIRQPWPEIRRNAPDM